MTTRTNPWAIALLLASHVFHHADAQEVKASPAEPKTKLEAFKAKSGAVIIRGFSKAEPLKLGTTGSFVVVCNEFKDASSGMKVYGILLTVASKMPFIPETEATSFIDYDEIDSLLKGIEYISKIDKTTTKLEKFEATYKTKDDLEVSTYSNLKGDVQSSVQSGRTVAFLSLAELGQFAKFISKAKETLDELKK